MTVETQGNKKSWIGDGSTTVYAYPYPFIEKDNIEVYLDGIIQTEGYSIQTLSSYDSGANIIFESAPENGVIVLIRRNIGITQEVSYPENGEFPAKSHEGALDKLTLILLDNDSENIKLNPTSTELFNPTLPVPVAKKGLRINDDGDGFELTENDIDDILSDPGFQVVSEDLLEGENSSIHRVANDLTNIDAVNANKENIDIVAENIEDVNAVGQNISSVLNVANDLTNIDAVNANKENIDIVADDIQSIVNVANDLENIDNASEYVDNAEIWAEGTDEEVQLLGGIHSSKGWADISSQGQIQTDWLQNDDTQKDYIKNKPTNLSDFIDDLGTDPIHSHSQAMNVLPTSGTIALTDNSANSIAGVTGNITFTLPTVTNNTTLHEIFVQMNMSTTVYSIDMGLGTPPHWLTEEEPDLTKTGNYNLYWEYDKANQYWKGGTLKGGAGS